MKRVPLRRRTPLRSTTPLRPGKPLETRTELRRGGPIRGTNPERRSRTHAEAFGPHADRIRGMACCLCGAAPPSDPHHARSRGAGGKWWHLVPLCRSCHLRFHAKGLAPWPGLTQAALLGLAAWLAWQSHAAGVAELPEARSEDER